MQLIAMDSWHTFEDHHICIAIYSSLILFTYVALKHHNFQGAAIIQISSELQSSILSPELRSVFRHQ